MFVDPKTPKTVAVVMPRSLVDELAELAEQDDRKISTYIRKVLKQHVKDVNAAT